jgi:hypothetical protein
MKPVALISAARAVLLGAARPGRRTASYESRRSQDRQDGSLADATAVVPVSALHNTQKGRRCMTHHDSPLKSFVTLAAVVFAVAGFSTRAWAAVAGINKGIINAGSADFGTGGHYLGSPTQPYTITWDYSVSGSTLIKTPRIQGYLYIDSLFGGGCARLKVLYQNLSGTTISSQTSRRAMSTSPGCG